MHFFFQDGQDPCIHFPSSNLPQCFEIVFVYLSPGTACHSQENHGDSPRGRDGKDHKTSSSRKRRSSRRFRPNEVQKHRVFQHLKSVKRLGEDFGRWMIMGFSWILIGEDWWGIYWELHGLMIWWDSMGHDVIVNQWVLLQGLQQTSPVFQVYTCLYLLDCPGCNML